MQGKIATKCMAMQQGKLSPQEEGATLLSSYLSFLEEASKNGDFFHSILHYFEHSLPIFSNAAPAPRGRVGRITKLTEQDRIGYAQLSKMSLNTLLRLFTEASYDGEGKKIDRYLCRLMSPDDHFGRTNFISFNPCDFEVGDIPYSRM